MRKSPLPLTALTVLAAFGLAACSPAADEEPAPLSADLAEGGAEREASVDMLAAWLLDTDRAPAPEAQALSTQWGHDLVYDDPDAPLSWVSQDGETPGPDTTVRRFTDESSGLDFLAVGLRLDYDEVADFTDGMTSALAATETPQVPGVVGTAEDHEHYYLSAVLDLNFVEPRTDAAVESFTADLFAPVDHWREGLR